MKARGIWDHWDLFELCWVSRSVHMHDLQLLQLLSQALALLALRYIFEVVDVATNDLLRKRRPTAVCTVISCELSIQILVSCASSLILINKISSGSLTMRWQSHLRSHAFFPPGSLRKLGPIASCGKHTNSSMPAGFVRSTFLSSAALQLRI